MTGMNHSKLNTSLLIQDFTMLPREFCLDDLGKWRVLANLIRDVLEDDACSVTTKLSGTIHLLLAKQPCEDAPSPVAVSNCLGVAFACLKNFTLASSYFRRSLLIALEDQTLPPDISVAVSLNLAESYRMLAEELEQTGPVSKSAYNEKEVGSMLSSKLFLQALEQREATFGTDHPLVAECCCRLGRLHTMLDNFSTANHYLTRALLIFRRQDLRFAIDHAITLARLGDMFLRSGRPSLAVQQYRLTLDMFETRITHHHTQLALFKKKIQRAVRESRQHHSLSSPSAPIFRERLASYTSIGLIRTQVTP